MVEKPTRRLVKMMYGLSQVDRLISYQKLRKASNSGRKPERKESDGNVDSDSFSISEEAQRKFDASKK